MNKEKKKGVFEMENINLSIKDILKKKIIEKEKKLRTERLNNINNKRFNELDECSNNNINMQLDDLSSNEMNFDTYIENIMNNFKENCDEYIYQSLNDYHISFCPKCSFPVIAIGNYVICCNKCFKFEINSNCFNEKFTLDNLMDNYLQTLKQHSQCNSDISVLYFDNNNILLMCSKCLNNLF
jgi:hypothetical protein